MSPGKRYIWSRHWGWRTQKQGESSLGFGDAERRLTERDLPSHQARRSRGIEVPRERQAVRRLRGLELEVPKQV